MFKGIMLVIALFVVSFVPVYASTAYINGTAVDPGGDGPSQELDWSGLSDKTPDYTAEDEVGTLEQETCTNQEMLAAKILDTGDCFMENFMNDLTNAIEEDEEED